VLWAFVLPALRREQSWRDFQARRMLRVGTDASLAPFSFYDAEGWRGVDADLAQLLSQRLALTLQAVPVGFDGRYDALKTNLIDVAISAVSIDESQTQDAAYSLPYVDVGPRLILPAAATSDALDGKRVAVALGSESDRVARRLERRSAAMQRITTESDADALDDLRSGAFDAAVIEGVTAMRAGCPRLGAGPADASLRCVPVAPNAYVIAVRAADSRLLDAINHELSQLATSGELDVLVKRWLR
jgi:polar amino acid transport system substrate-binding protein